MATKYAVLVNLDANNGRAARRWESIAAEVAQLLPPDTQVISFRTPTDIAPILDRLLQEGVQGFISAGGDGSANILLNLLMRQTREDARQLTLGGIGLGSSNDFVKPKVHFLKGLPTRMEVQNAGLVDVGKAEFLNASGDWQTQYFIANASLGVTAEANWFFNHGDWFLRVTKDRWTDLAIVYAAIRTIIRFKNFHATLAFEEQKLETKLSNLAILKSPYVSGSFHFDDPVQRDDGLLGMNACLDMNKTELLGVLAGLAKGRFQGRPKTMRVAINELSVKMQMPVALEMDGEVFQTSEVRFSVIPRAIKLMGL
jgi:diacylglycerol kinase (ATP)